MILQVKRSKYVTFLLLFLTCQLPASPATVDDALSFMAQVEASLLELSTDASQAQWIYANFITEDSQALSARASRELSQAVMVFAKDATRFDHLKLPSELARKFKLLKLGTPLPVPADAEKARELSETVAQIKGMYGKGSFDGKALGELGKIMASSRDPEELLKIWSGWRTVSPDMRPLFERYVTLANEGARDLGFNDMGDMWCSKYDMEASAFASEVDRLWEQVKPLYVSLHAYVRKRLRQQYGAEVVSAKGPIPAHLLGNMWAQTWENIYPLVAPKDGDPGYDLTKILQGRKDITEREMVRIGEGFFTSMGFAALPETFWKRSLFTKPADRDVVCHASAWDLDSVEDLRIKMCIEINAEDFTTIHHELGHNFYQRAYNKKPFLFRDSANDGFHEAVGDTLSLSITPNYLVRLGYLEKEPPASKDIGLLLKMALERVAFLPFGLLIDQWRWKVFAGKISPQEYNRTWWELRTKYQGIAAPVERSEMNFDPGAKYHVAANVAYTRYFLARILQFQFHRALARDAGVSGPVHRASIYGSKKAGKNLETMLEMGSSRPWPMALAAITGSKKMDGNAILEYFAPLQIWLDKQNKGEQLGW